MILVIEDDTEWLSIIAEHDSAITASNAKIGLDLLATEPVTLVFCDFHGIQKDGKTAHDIVKFCLERKIACSMTTSDIRTQMEFEQKYGVSCISKIEMVETVRAKAS